jgi:hypothetical protein
MPVAFTVDTRRRLVLSRGWAVVTDRELLIHARALAADPRFEPSCLQLTDLRQVSSLKITVEGVHQMALVSPVGAGARRAILVGTDEVYGVARMFQMLREGQPDHVQIFRELNGALAWLGVLDQKESLLLALASAPTLLTDPADS